MLAASEQAWDPIARLTYKTMLKNEHRTVTVKSPVLADWATVNAE
jgi:hypothetical protein